MLRATTCLGENTVPILRDLLTGLRAQGVDSTFDESLDFRSREAAFRAGEMDLVWACGLLTVETQGAGGMTEIFAAPVFAGEHEAVYRSAIVVRSDSNAASITDTMSERLAVNEYGSWSGYEGFVRWLASNGLAADSYPTTVLTGSHRNSAMAVADGTADVAAIDHTVFELLAAEEQWIADLRVLTYTHDWPAPPFSIRPGTLDPTTFMNAGQNTSGLVEIVPASIDQYRHMGHAENKSHSPATE